MERIQQDPRLTANRSKSVNSSIAEEDAACGYVGHKADPLWVLSEPHGTSHTGSRSSRSQTENPILQSHLED